MVKKKEWDEEELELFKYMYEHGTSHKELKLAFNISDNVIRSTAKKLGLNNPKNNKEKDGLYFCAMCKQYKPKEIFNKNKNKRLGINSYCKNCENRYKKEWGKKKKEKIYNPNYIPEKTKEEVNGGTTKVCSNCKMEKPIDEFDWNTKYKYIRSRCKECAKKINEQNELKLILKRGY